MRTRMVVKTPECNTIEVLHSKWGGLDISLNGRIVKVDTIPWLWKMNYEYSIIVGPEGDHEFVLVIHRPFLKIGHYRYEFYFDGKLMKTKYHSFFFAS
jgi:hypothetical protein